MNLHEDIRAVIPKLEGWTDADRCIEMADLMLKENPKLCVELGVFGGRTLIAQALTLREVGGGHVFGIDPWTVDAAIEGESEENQKWWSRNVDLNEIYRGTIRAIENLQLGPWTTTIRNTSQNVHGLFSKIDQLLIDGNHSEIASCRDVELYLPKVKSTGIIFFDDVDWPTTKKAVAMLEAACDVIKDGGKYKIFRKR